MISGVNHPPYISNEPIWQKICPDSKLHAELHSEDELEAACHWSDGESAKGQTNRMRALSSHKPVMTVAAAE